MRKILLFVGIVYLSLSCSNKRGIPPTVMQPPEFQNVLTDILLADGLSTERSYKDTLVKITDANASYFLKVFELHGVSKNEFMRSYNFYLQRPDLLRIITDSISAVLNRRNTQLSTDTVKPKPNGNYSKKTRIGNGNK